MPLPPFLTRLIPTRRLAWLAATLVIAFAGGGFFAWLAMPAGWLSGALVATGVAALAGAPVGVERNIRLATYILLGTSMGSAVTPETLHGITTWPVTMLVLIVSVPVMMVAVVFYLERFAGWDRRSAFFAAAPGALSTVLVMAETSGADTRRVVFGQSIRLFILVTLLPPTLGGFGHQPAGTLPITPVVPDIATALLSIGVGIAGAFIAERIRFPGGAMVGAMLSSALVHGFGLIEGRLPDIFLIIGFVVLGANTGSRFAGTKLQTLRHFLVDSMAALLIATLVALAFAFLGSWLAGEPFSKVLLAYVPGALEAMTIMAFVLGLDPAFVAAHHLTRFLGLALAIPLVTRIFFGRAAIPSENVEIDQTEPKD